MNIALLAGAVLAAFLAAAHSYLGERYLLMRLLAREDLPRMRGGTEFTKHTLRLAWHVTSLLALGHALLLVALASADGSAAATQAQIISATCAVSGIWAFFSSRGRHLSWVVFLLIAVLVWSGSR
jgi:hypothetical protein